MSTELAFMETIYKNITQLVSSISGVDGLNK
jgi:hypothetical protein